MSGRMEAIGALTLLMLLAAPRSPAEAADAPAISVRDIEKSVHKLIDEGRYAEALAAIAKTKESGVFAGSAALQYAQRNLSVFISGTQNSYYHEKFETTCGDEKAVSAKLTRGTHLKDAISEILVRAKHTRIVILNEDHYNPRNRYFGLKLAKALRPLGYSVLAVEALTNYDSIDLYKAQMERLAQDGFVRLGSGLLTAEPVFADFLRQSMKIGYRPLAYEALTSRTIDLREAEQARLLFDRVIATHPDDKFLIYVGFSHAAEQPVPDTRGAPHLWMAGRLKALTQIDPLTIDQTTNPYRCSVPAKSRHVDDYIAINSKGPVVEGKYANSVNLQISYSLADTSDGRPDWLIKMGRRKRKIPVAASLTSGFHVVQAFSANEPNDAVPLDQFSLEIGKSALPASISAMVHQVPVRIVVSP